MEVRAGALWLGGVRASDLVGRYGSPLFVMEEREIRERYRRLAGVFSHRGSRLLYAVKANPNLRIIELLHREGAGIDCCSIGEVHIARKAGVPASDISFTGTALTEEDARRLACERIHVNVDALSQLERFLPLFNQAGFNETGLGIRVNPGVGTGLHRSCTTGGSESKLGIPIELVPRAFEIARSFGAPIPSLHVHTGSGGLDVDHFRSVARIMFELAEPHADDLESIDLGGGIGVPHDPADRPFDIEGYAKEALFLLDRWNGTHDRPLQLLIEPGQYLVSEAGWLLMRVVVRKETPAGRTFLITDSSFNHYLGAALYQSYHEFVKADDLEAPATETVDICGHLCNTGDTFAHDRRMPRLEEGDLIAMANSGAYGISRAACYNSRPIPAEVLVGDGNARPIRRRQTLDDLLLWQV